MTCIVALRDAGIVHMGADSAGVAGYSIHSRVDPKIYMVGPFMFGFTSSFRMGQLLGHAFVPPDRDPRHSIEKFMSTTFIDAVRTCLKNGGYAAKENEVESGGNFLVAYAGRIFNVASDYQVGESHQPFDAVGCGADIALGSLHTSERCDRKQTAKDRIRFALMAAETFSCGVRGPFVITQSEAA
jgi:ATP-dependent protease HslVU (ClpYQ) peptidase subunit